MKSRLAPLFSFFSTLRSHQHFDLGLEEYFSLVEVLQQDASYLEPQGDTYQDYQERLLRLCQLLWLKPGRSEVLFDTLFRQSLGNQVDFIEEKEVKIDIGHRPLKIKDETAKKEIAPTPTQKKKKKEQPRPKTPQVRPTEGLDVLYLNIIDKKTSKEIQTETEEELPQDLDFKFHDFFPGINARRLQQQWRFLYRPKLAQHSHELDVDASIAEYAAHGFLHKWKFKRKRKNQTRLLALIDHRGSMTAFKTLGELLLETADRSLGFPCQRLYFNDLPKKFTKEGGEGYYVYRDRGQTDHLDLLKLLKRESKNKNLCILVFSDAGAGKALFNARRRQETEVLIEHLKTASHRLVWFNPYPEDRWNNNVASGIQKQIFMAEANEQGLKAAINVFRGKSWI